MSPWHRHLAPGLSSLPPYRVEEPGQALKLDANEAPLDPRELSPELVARLQQALDQTLLQRYPDPQARLLRERWAHLLGVPPARLVLGNGSDELILLLLAALAGSPQSPSTVLIFPPTFTMYRRLALTLGLRPLEVPLTTRFTLDLEAARAAVTAHRPALVFLANPNNPTGSHHPTRQVLALADAVGEAGGLMVVDEAYAPFCGSSLLSELAGRPHAALLTTLSKVGLAALRLGALVAPEELAEELEKIRLPYNIGALNQALGAALLEQPAWMEKQAVRVAAERRRLADELERRGFEVFPSAANLLLFRVADGPTLFQALRQQGVLVRNLHQEARLAHCLRVTVGSREQNDRFLAALEPAQSLPPASPLGQDGRRGEESG